jgi:salicylate hydroxylase
MIQSGCFHTIFLLLPLRVRILPSYGSSRRSLAVNVQTYKSWGAMDFSSDLVPASSQQFTPCTTCRGLGKIEKGLSRKALQRYKRTKIETSEPLPKRTDACLLCQGSGLLQSTSAASVDTSLPHVAIIGCGLGGLALASALRHRGISHSVYERDAHFYVRSQGYGLTMQQASKALQGFGIKSLRDGITSTKHVVHTADGTVVGQWGFRHWGRGKTQTPKRQNIHIARQSLRYELLQMAGGSEAIAWDHRLLDYEEIDNAVKLRFQVGDHIVESTVDLVVGADGIRSRVREQLIGDETPLRYLDCLVILGICLLPDGLVSDLLDGETVFQTADGETRIYIMPYSSTEYMWQLSFPLDESAAKALSNKGPGALKKEALARSGLWHLPVPQIISNTPEELVSGYPVYDRSLLSAEHLHRSGRVTLIGDASHPMSPFKGQGANQALLDALQLARALHSMKHRKTALSSVLADFEAEMLIRSAVKVKASANAAQFLHSDIAIQKGNVTRGAANAASEGP